MKQIRFKDKGRKGQVLGLGHVDDQWKTVREADIKYFEQLNTTLSAPDEKGNRKVVRKKELKDFGIEVQDAPDPKPETNKEDSKK